MEPFPRPIRLALRSDEPLDLLMVVSAFFGATNRPRSTSTGLGEMFVPLS